MPNRLEWEDVQTRYKEAMKDFLASKEKPVTEDDGAKDIPVITISDDNDVAMECSAENVDDKSSVKKSDGDEATLNEVVPVDDACGDKETAAAAEDAVVVNPDSSITDKALTDNKQKFLSLIIPTFLYSLYPPFPHSSVVLLLGSFVLLFPSSRQRIIS